MVGAFNGVEWVSTRATLALTKAQRFCFVMCLLDMKGLVGAATVVGSLQQGSGICEQLSPSCIES